jgi:hypothetical protein
MSVLPFYNPRFRALDSAGDPLAGGKLYTYSAGTTTALATYTNKTGLVSNANPVILNANGEADVWLTPGVDYKFVLKDSSDVVQWTEDNIPTPTVTNASAVVVNDPGGRLTLTSGTPVTTSDVTGASTIYYALHTSNQIPIYDGTNWGLQTFTELSQTTTDTTKSPAAVANDSNYDLFVWNDSGTIRLSRGPPWTSDTARGTGAGTTELFKQDGRYVNNVSITNGPGARRGTYVGSFRSSSSALANDTVKNRLLFNAYNRVSRAMRIMSQSAPTYTYTLTTARQAGGTATNQVNFLVGLAEDAIQASLQAYASNTSANVNVVIGFGLDSTTTPSVVAVGGGATTQVAGQIVPVGAHYREFPSIGYHALNWLEGSAATGTTTWYASILIGSFVANAGMHATIMG